MGRLGGVILAVLSWGATALLAQEAHHHQSPASANAGSAQVVEDQAEQTADAAKKGAVAAPVFSPAPGSYPTGTTVAITTATAGATIYYTTNGTSPSRKTSPAYHGPIPRTAKITLKAFGYKKGMAASAVTSGVYTVSGPPPPPDTGGTLFLATLTPQGAATSNGSGSSTLTLSTNESAAYLRFSFSGLSGPITGEHIHGPDGAILFDIDTTPPQNGVWTWRIAPVGTYTAASIVAALRGGQCYLNLHTAAYPAGEIKGYFHQSNGSQTFTPPPAPPPLPGGPPTADDAARFLLQATYGPQPGEVEALQQKGFSRWLDEQMGLPRASHLATFDALAAEVPPDQKPNTSLVRESFVGQAVQGNDQLRQRVTFALSELFVVSDVDAGVRNGPDGLASYLDLLASRAFGNFRDLLEAVTLSPTMGQYLDMAGSSKSIPERGLNPNENYAREILQLFSIGLYELHPDGTLRLDTDNQPIPTYEQDVVKAFARAFTGWTFGGQNQRIPDRFFRPQRNYRIPMEPWDAYHATDQKVLLDNKVLPSGLSARQDLSQALDVIFDHPNVGPFFCRFMIQRLVTANPSPSYVYRCGQAFANNGAGVRGDLGAVVREILLDYEARSTTTLARPDDGHLREPVVRLLGLLRTFDATPRQGRWRFNFDRAGASAGEIPLRAPTVFNFFEPTFALPGEIAQAGLVSPEFQISTETTVVGAANLAQAVLGNGRNGPFAFVLTPFVPPQVGSDDALLDKVDLLLFAGGMSDQTRAILKTALADPDFPHATPEQKVATLFWLAGIAPESVVQK
ncbi:MAG TPA: DUF1800 family protein [Thermoanaerobaculia bacterium]|jgi:uncharacterized protein (DUF1800 family)|nr:DUF1800 family protein [Thermoanaerobaculia bacterium]